MAGSPGWSFGTDGVSKSVRDKETGEYRESLVLTWYPQVIDAVAYMTQEGKVTARSVKIRVGEQEEIVTLGDISRGTAWGRFLLADGYDDRNIRTVLCNIVTTQAAKMPHHPGRPYFKDGHLQLPPAEYLPDGYTRGEDSRPEALRELVTELTRHPTAALIMALSAIAPWVSALQLQPFTLHIEGGTTSGKTTAITAAASLWGVGYKGVVKAWAGTMLGAQGAFRDIGCLPVYRDELGTLPITAAQRSSLFSSIMEGCYRAARTREDLSRPSATWASICFSTGNISAVPAHVASSGTAKGVLEIHSNHHDPVIPEDRGDIVRKLSNADGMAGAWVPHALALTVDDVRAVHEQAAAMLPRPEAGGVEWHMWRHMVLALTGASLLAEATGCHLLVASVLQRAQAVITETVERVAEMGSDSAVKLLEAVFEARMIRPDAFGEGMGNVDQVGFPATTADGKALLCVYTTRLGDIVRAAGVEDYQSALRMLRTDGMVHTTPRKGLRYMARRGGRVIPVYAFAEEGGNGGNGGNTAGQGPSTCYPPPAPGGNEPAQPPAAPDEETPGQAAIVAVTPPQVPAVTPSTGEGGGNSGHASPRAGASDDEFVVFAAAVRKHHQDEVIPDSDIAAALTRWHETTDNLWYLGSPGRTGVRLFQQLEARYGADRELERQARASWADGLTIASPLATNFLTKIDDALGQALVSYDVNAMYLGPAEGIELGTGTPEWKDAPGLDWDHVLAKLPGYAQLARDVRGPALGQIYAADSLVPFPMARYLVERGFIAPGADLTGALIWPEHRRWLRTWSRRVKTWRTELRAARDAPDARYALSALKEMYAAFLGGQLASVRHNPSETYQPAWRDQNVALAKANMFRSLDKAQPAPIGTMVDTAWFLINPADHPTGIRLGIDCGTWKRTDVRGVTPPIAQAIAGGRPGVLQRLLANP